MPVLPCLATGKNACATLLGHRQECLCYPAWPQARMPVLPCLATGKNACATLLGHRQECLCYSARPQAGMPVLHRIPAQRLIRRIHNSGIKIFSGSADGEGGFGQGSSVQDGLDPPAAEEPAGAERAEGKAEPLIAPQFQPGPGPVTPPRRRERPPEGLLETAPGIEPAEGEEMVPRRNPLDLHRGVDPLPEAELAPAGAAGTIGRGRIKEQGDIGSGRCRIGLPAGSRAGPARKRAEEGEERAGGQGGGEDQDQDVAKPPHRSRGVRPPKPGVKAANPSPRGGNPRSPPPGIPSSSPAAGRGRPRSSVSGPGSPSTSS